jgi:D-amino-acid dehydrogenase
MNQPAVTVIGGGVIGLATAYQIALDGTKVTLVDSGEPRFGTSNQNAGWVAPSHVIPFAAPGMVSMGVEQLLKRTGAFGFSPTAGPLLASWTMKFMRSCTEEHVNNSVPALTELLNNSIAGFEKLIANEGLKRAPEALWYIFSSDKAAEHAHHEVELMTRYGIGVREIDINEARTKEPILKDTAKAVVEFDADFGIDPKSTVEILTRLCIQNGVTIRTDETVARIAATKNDVSIATNKDSWTSEYLVIAAGVWSRELAKSLGANLPIMPAKGHSITIPGLANQPMRPFLLAEQRIAGNALDWGLRLSTGYTLTSPKDRNVDMKAVSKLVDTASKVLDIPNSTVNVNPWTGLRPSSPDGLPYIGPLSNAPRVIMATGHGMLGTMMAMGTAVLVADQIAGRSTSRETLKFSPSRP